MNTRLLHWLIALILTCISSGKMMAQSLEGHITLGVSEPAAFATVYIPSTGQGTVTDHDGRYQLDGVPMGTVEIEYSYLGYSTVKRQFTFDEAKRYAHDVQLDQLSIMLDDVYITPNGEEPALYILRKVSQQADANRKSLQRYEAQQEFVFHAQDVDFLPEVLPKAVNFIISSIMKLKHRGAIYEFCCTHEKVDARMSSSMICDHSKITYSNERLLSSSPEIPDKAREQLFKITHKDLFDKLYGDKTDYCMKVLKKGKCKYKLKGSYEEHGRVINVLVNDNAGDEDDPGVSTIYVVEDDWCILRSEFVGKMTHTRIECRDIGAGIYMPVSYLDEPTFDAFDLQKDIEKYKTEQADKLSKGEKIGSSERKFLERLERFAQKHSKPRPSIAVGSSIRYTKAQITK